MRHHREYYVADGVHTHIWAYLTLEPTGWAACVAYDTGWPLVLEPAYVPRVIVEGRPAGAVGRP